jgi:hypothetical protein
MVNIDIERSNFESALRNSEVGHTYVKFHEGNGRQYTYGFYPESAVPNENRRTVPGCVHHPDRTHESCIDDTVTYSLSQAQYQAALATAQRICHDRHTYGVDYTCTTYAGDVAQAAGQSLPSSKSEAMEIYYQPVPPIDNPNTLYENVQKERRSDQNQRRPFWNDPCVNRCEAEFDSCLRSGGGMNPSRPAQCMIARSRCNAACPRPRTQRSEGRRNQSQ